MLAAIIVLFNKLDIPWAILSGCFTYVILSLTPELTLTKDDRNRAHALNAHEYEKAIHSFERSAAFFQRYPRLDRYRYLLLFPVRLEATGK